MKKNILISAMMLAVLTLMWGCKSSEDDPDSTFETNSGQIDWQKSDGPADWSINWTGNESKPIWADASYLPNSSDYESWMILMVELQPELAAHSSPNDLMAVFVGNELRAIASPAVTIKETKEVQFILKIFGNEESDKTMPFTLSYYNSNLHQIFTIKGQETFYPEAVYGVNEKFVPNLLEGCPKYPVQTELKLMFPHYAQTQLQPKVGDMVAVLVDGECRGMALVNEKLFNSPFLFTVFGKKEGETGTVYYYNATENAIWNTKKTISITQGIQDLKIQ